jgi:peptide/nickel transport system permease protein
MNIAWLARRLALVVPTLLAASVVVFLMIHLAPGDAAQAMLGPMASGDALEQLRDELGLNDPVPVQYLRWLENAAQGDLGRSIRQQLPVSELVKEKFQNTAILGVVSLSVAVVIGLALGFLAALNRGSVLDRFVIILASSGIAIPSFFLGLLLSYIVGTRLGWLPSSGMYSLQGGGGLGDLARHLVLPALALAAAPIAVVARMTRSSTLEVTGADYVRTARAKGLTESSVTMGHIFKNALIPIIHLLGLQAGILLSATALVEVVFAWPGIGSLMVDSILTRDLPVTQGCVLAIAAVYALVSVVADVAHAAADPRLQHE